MTKRQKRALGPAAVRWSTAWLAHQQAVGSEATTTSLACMVMLIIC